MLLYFAERIPKWTAMILYVALRMPFLHYSQYLFFPEFYLFSTVSFVASLINVSRRCSSLTWNIKVWKHIGREGRCSAQSKRRIKEVDQWGACKTKIKLPCGCRWYWHVRHRNKTKCITRGSGIFHCHALMRSILVVHSFKPVWNVLVESIKTIFSFRTSRELV